eukprot:1157870-Pelagomonas_calceolata.AAC.2
MQIVHTSSLLGGRGGQLGIGTISAPGFVSEGCSSEEPSLMLGALAVEEVWVRNDDVLDGTPFAVVCLMPTLQYSPLPIRCETAAWCCCESVLSAIEGLRAASDSSTACSLALFFLDAALDHPPVALRHGGPPLVALIFTPGLKLMSHEILFGWQQDAGDCSPAWPFGTSFSLRCCSTSCCVHEHHKQRTVSMYGIRPNLHNEVLPARVGLPVTNASSPPPGALCPSWRSSPFLNGTSYGIPQCAGP